MKLNYLSVKNISEKELLLPAADSIDICIFPIDDFSSIADDESSLSLLERKEPPVCGRGGISFALWQAESFFAES